MDVEEFHFTQATDLQDLSGTPGSREYQLSRSVLEQPTEPRLAALWRFPRLTFPTRWTGSKSMARRKASMRCRRLLSRSRAPAGTGRNSSACETSHRKDRPYEDHISETRSLRDLYPRLDRAGSSRT